MTDEEPMYEDVDALQKKKKDFEDYELTTSMNDAYIAMDPDKNDDLYDNDWWVGQLLLLMLWLQGFLNTCIILFN